MSTTTLFSQNQVEYIDQFIHKICQKWTNKNVNDMKVLFQQCIQEYNETSPPVKKPRTSTKKTDATTEKAQKKTLKKEILNQPAVLQKIIANRLKFFAKCNSFGNYIHEETSLVIDPLHKVVKGYQNPDGSVLPLTYQHVLYCKEFRLPYVEPHDFGVIEEESQETPEEELIDEEEDFDEDDDEEEDEEMK